jgi:hypothetical protein
MQDVLNAPPNSDLSELRGVSLYPAGSDRAGQLVVANSHKSGSAVLRYSANVTKNAGHRDFIDQLLVMDKQDPALIHPYFLLFATLSFHVTPRRLFVACQDSSSVLAFDADTGTPMPVGSHWLTTYPHATFDPGTLVPSMAAVGYAGGGLSSPRSMGIGLQRNQLFVVDSEGDCVRGYEVTTGAFLGDVWCGTDSSNRDKGKYPVGLVLMHDARQVSLHFAPSTLTFHPLYRPDPHISTLVLTLEAEGTLVAIDISQWPDKPVPAPVTLLSGMNSPAGVSLSCDGHFYIANRKDRSIVRSKAPSHDQMFSSAPSFSALKVGSLDIFISGLTDEPEQIMLMDSALAGTCN